MNHFTIAASRGSAELSMMKRFTIAVLASRRPSASAR
jgi:hypothetical protein